MPRRDKSKGGDDFCSMSPDREKVAGYLRANRATYFIGQMAIPAGSTLTLHGTYPYVRVSDWPAFQAQRRQDRNHPLLRAGQDAGSAAPHPERPSGL